MCPNKSHNQARAQEARAGANEEARSQRKVCPGKMVWQCSRHVSGFRVWSFRVLFPPKQKKTNEFCILARGEAIWTIIKSAALQTALRGHNYQWLAELGDNVGLLTGSKYYRQYCQHSRIMLTMFTVFISKGAMHALYLTGLWHINKETGCLQFELV